MPFHAPRFVILLTLLLVSARASAADYTVKAVDGLPKDLSPTLSKGLAAGGYQVTGKDGPLCTVWFAQTVPVKEGFSPTLSVKYPLTPGELVGLLRIDKGTEFTDFREQVITPGYYTMRYAQQPQDGNHIGTSELRDFLLALPAKEDAAPQTASDLDKIISLSEDASGTTHPAIIALKPADGAKPGDAKLTHDSKDDLWILEASAGAEHPLVLRMVVVGFAVE